MKLVITIDSETDLTIIWDQLMASLADLTAKVASVQTSTDSIPAAMTTLVAKIKALETTVVTGGLTPAEVQTLSDHLDTLTTSSVAAKAAVDAAASA